MALPKVKRDYLLMVGYTAEEVDRLERSLSTKAAAVVAQSGERVEKSGPTIPWRPVDELTAPGGFSVAGLVLKGLVETAPTTWEDFDRAQPMRTLDDILTTGLDLLRMQVEWPNTPDYPTVLKILAGLSARIEQQMAGG